MMVGAMLVLESSPERDLEYPRNVVPLFDFSMYAKEASRPIDTTPSGNVPSRKL